MIKINEKYSLTADTLNYKLIEHQVVKDVKSENYGEVRDMPVGYFPNLKHLMTALVEKEIRETELQDLQTVVAKIEELKELVTEFCTNIKLHQE